MHLSGLRDCNFNQYQIRTRQLWVPQKPIYIKLFLGGFFKGSLETTVCCIKIEKSPSVE
jgi:hypothetical protein